MTVQLSLDRNRLQIAVVGLSYVGLPLAVEFGKLYNTIGFDIDEARIAELGAGRDSTLEIEPELLAEAAHLSFTNALDEIAGCNVYIVTVPTPIDSARRPDLTPLCKASEALDKELKAGDTVVYESTVYPGCTEEVCVPILEQMSGLKFDQDFFFGYSPERINPGDKEHRVTTILKVTSGSTPAAAKVIEYTQRDLNIALVNDLAILFNKLGIDTLEVLEAAGTKWYFLPRRPGLVGGQHCISVDPYYLTHKAQEVGHHPDVILAGRRTNDCMGEYVADQVIKLMVLKGINPVRSRILVLGLAFKENCPDLRNTRMVDIIEALRGYNAQVDVIDPWVDSAEAKHEYGLGLTLPRKGEYDAITVAVGHEKFRKLGATGIRAYGRPGADLNDVKYVLPREVVDGRL